jgi:hypothetical protein
MKGAKAFFAVACFVLVGDFSTAFAFAVLWHYNLQISALVCTAALRIGAVSGTRDWKV